MKHGQQYFGYSIVFVKVPNVSVPVSNNIVREFVETFHGRESCSGTFHVLIGHCNTNDDNPWI